MPRNAPRKSAPRYAVTLHDSSADSVTFLLHAHNARVALFTVLSHGTLAPTLFDCLPRPTLIASVAYAAARAVRYMTGQARSTRPAALEALFCDCNGIPQRDMPMHIPNEYTLKR